MPIRPRHALAAAVLGLATAGCSTGSEPALCNVATDLAVVNGAAITCEQLHERSPQYDDADVLVDGEALRAELTGLIRTQALVDAAASEFGVGVTDAQIDERLANPPDRWAGLLTQSLSVAESRTNAQLTLISDAVVPELVKSEFGDLAGFVEQRPEDFVRACVRTIVVLSETEAIEAKARIDAGEDFLVVRNDFTIETTLPDGLLVDQAGNCPISVGFLGPDFARLTAEAPIGEVVGPVADGGGAFHVIRVEERIGPDFAGDLEAGFLDFLDLDLQSQIFNPWASDALRDAEVDVASAIGRWSSAAFGIAPPGFNATGG